MMRASWRNELPSADQGATISPVAVTPEPPQPSPASPPPSDFEGLLALLGVAMWAYDPHKNTVTWQQLFAEQPGKARPQATERLADVVGRYAEQDRPALLRHFESALRDGHHGPVRLTLQANSGEATVVESAAIRTETQGGVPVVRGVLRTATEVEGSATADTVGLLASLTAISPSSIILVDSAGLIRSANPEFLKTFHLADDKGIVGRHIRTVGNLVGKSFVATITMLLENEKDIVRAQQRFQLPDNSSVTMNYRSQRFALDGAKRGVLFAAEVAATDAVDLGVVFQRTPTPTMALALPDYTVVAANAAAQRTFSLRREHVGREQASQILMKAEDLAQIERDIETKGSECGHVCPVRSLTGGSLNYRVKAAALVEDGRSFLVLEFHDTISHRDKHGGKAQGSRKGLFMRVVDHIDF